MKHIKGFSLIEVLISLMLVTTLAFMLSDQHTQSRQLIKRWVLQANASHILDRVNEGLYEPSPPASHLPESYDLKIQRHHKTLIVHLEWPNRSGALTRIVRSIG